MLNDLRFAVRMLGKNPGFTIVALLLLMLGIGANTAVFSLVNVLLFKPLSVQQPEQLARVYEKEKKPDGAYRSLSYPEYVEVREKNTAFVSMAAFSVAMTGLQEGENTRRVFVATVSANYFSTFGVRLPLGRDFSAQEERPGSAVPVAVVSYQYWQRHGAEREVIGRTLKLNGRSFNIVGVAPESFSGTSVLFSPEVWLPLGVHELVVNDFMAQKDRSLKDRGNHALMVFGRLKPGVGLDAASNQLRPLADQLEQEYPAENKNQTLAVGGLSRLSIGTGPSSDRESKAMAILLMPMAAMVLLTACLNLANMMLARAAARRKEIAIRVALGGGRIRILRQLLAEGLVLALAGGALALEMAYWVTHLLVNSLGPKIPFMTIVFDARPDLRVLTATFLFCVLATVLFALVPALRTARTDVVQDLKEQTLAERSKGHGWRLLGLRNLLVMGQVALSLVLLVVAGLFLRGAQKANAANPGFRFEQGLLLEVDASLAGYDEPRTRPLYHTMLERVRALPGVQSVSMASMVPFGLFGDERNLEKAGATDAAQPGGAKKQGNKTVNASYVIIANDYFKTLGLSLLRGRDFDRLEVEGASAAPAAILDEEAVKRLWPGEDALGRQIQFASGDPSNRPTVMTIVGVVPALKQNLGDREAGAHVYVPFGQGYQSQMNLHVRLSSSDKQAESAMLRTVRAELRALDPSLPVLSANTLRDFHSNGLIMWFYRAGTRLFLAFAFLALLLAALGIYGVKAFVVARRTHEIGIRLALGATRRQVLCMVLAEGLKLTAVGAIVGSAIALAAGRMVGSKLYEVSGSDPLTFGVTLLVIAASASLASYLPARRAASVQPMAALRYE